MNTHSAACIACAVPTLALSGTRITAQVTPINWQSSPSFDVGTGVYTLLGAFEGSGISATLTWNNWPTATSRNLTVTEPFAGWDGLCLRRRVS